MNAEQENRLIELLKKGVYVGSLFPREFSPEAIRYRVKIIDKKIRAEIELSKTKGNNDLIITKVIDLKLGATINSQLLSKTITVRKPLFAKPIPSTVKLTGTIFLE